MQDLLQHLMFCKMNFNAIYICILALVYSARCGAKKCNAVTEFKCADGLECIHKSWRCDGEDDCKDASDERNCNRRRCKEAEFKCKNKRCISRTLRCDSIDHCGDNSDETGCSTLASYSCHLEGAFSCGKTNNCINEKNVCNKQKDCPNGEDESERCGVNECLVANGGCSQVCQDLKIGFKCSCKPGFALQDDGRSCSDVDECATYGTCEQECHNTAGSYKCQCSKEYTLRPDGKSCRARGQRPTLLIANLVDISQFSLDGSISSRVVYGKSMGGCLAMDINPHDGRLYWADYVKKTISRVHLNSTNNVEVVVNGKLTRAEGIAVDWVANNLYWTNAEEAVIEVSNVDGRFRKTLFSSGLQMPRGIAVSPAKRYIFWTDWGNNPKIERSSMDGTDRRTILGSGTLRWPNAVAVDHVLSRLYWVESGNGYIASSDFDGNDVRQIITSNTVSSFGLAAFEGSIYWTQTRGKVFAANKFDGTNKREIRGAYFKPYTVHINHVAAKPHETNPCQKKNGGCAHLCLLSSTTSQGFSCACEDGFILKADRKGCREV